MKTIASPKAPAAIGPYSQAIESGKTVYCSGQLGFNPQTKALVSGIEKQTEQVFANLKAVLEEAKCTLGNVVKTTVYLADMSNFPIVNGIYAKQFGDHKPARATVQVARLPLDGLVEIECIAVKE